jgi:hypothetical protein
MNKQIKVIILIVILTAVVVVGAVGIYFYTEKIKTDLPAKDNYQTEEQIKKANLIIVDNPRPNQSIKSPLYISGKARGFWFFEASFPVMLVNWDGLIIAEGIATATEDWMTEEFVPFTANLNFTIDPSTYSNRGALILKKDNPSGLPEHDDALEMPIFFADVLNKN